MSNAIKHCKNCNTTAMCHTDRRCMRQAHGLSKSAGSSPIYPQSVECNDGINRWTENKGGMTLRQHYAGLALQGLLANPDKSYDPDDAAKEAMIHADSMIYILEKNSREDS